MKPYLAEMLGTFVLVFGGVGSAVLAGDKIGYSGVAIAFGLALLAMVYTIGPVSGCHINPAVTLGLLFCGKIKANRAAGYVVAQIVGAIIACAFLLVIAKGNAAVYDPSISGFGANGYGIHSPGHYSLLAAFLTETILTSFLVVTVLGATDAAAPVGFAGLAIGLVLTLIHLVGIPVTNTSVNPARSIGPAIFVGGWALQQLWLFLVAPSLGALVAAGAYVAVRKTGLEITTREAEQALRSQQVERLRNNRIA